MRATTLNTTGSTRKGAGCVHADLPIETNAVTGGITMTFVGLRINSDAKVMSTDGVLIHRLIGAEEMVRGIFYFNHPSGSRLTNSAVFGRTTAGRLNHA
jgi:tricarballylate dehydrogenase